MEKLSRYLWSTLLFVYSPPTTNSVVDSLCQYTSKKLELPLNFITFISGFDRRRCDTNGKWEPEAPTCKETLCKNITTPTNGSMTLTTLRIGGRATFKCDFGFNLKGDDDIECLSSGSW